MLLSAPPCPPAGQTWRDGRNAQDLCRELGITSSAFYKWRQHYGGLEVKELKRMKELEEADLVQALQYKPGVLQRGEMQSGCFVRGGTNSHTTMLLQGVLS